MHNIPEALLNEILRYLGNRPFVEVAGLIQKIANAVEESIKANANPPTAQELEP